ncbi:MAG: methyl-accepting chemotaxis protein [Rhodospirillales bacterium]
MHLSIAQRIALGFATVIALTIGLGAYQFAGIGRMTDHAQDIAAGPVQAIQVIGVIASSQRDMRVYRERSATLSRSESDDRIAKIKSTQQAWHEAKAATVSAMEQLEQIAQARLALQDDVDIDETWSEMLETLRRSREALDGISVWVNEEFSRQTGAVSSAALTNTEALDQLRQKFNTEIQNLQALPDRLVDEIILGIEDTHEDTTTTALIVLVAVVLLGSAIAFAIHRSIMRPLYDFMAFVERVGEGDLTARTYNVGGDELGQLGVHLNEMADNLAASAQQTRAGTEQLNSATAELRASSQQQSSSTAEQNAAIQQITSTLEEIAQSGAQMTERAKSVAEAAKSTSSASKAGMDAAGETARTMQSIKEQAEAVAENIVSLTEKTQSVGDIIASVNDIAERSDLLALNAAIEASAAGEYGKSFSVVAEEMKVLAGQAKDATVQVRGILNDIQQGINTSVMQTEEAVKRSETGQRQAEEMEATIKTLADNIEQSVSTFEQIVAANNQQQIGIEQVADSIQNIREASEQMTAGNSDLEQSAASLAGLAQELQTSVERYRL